MWYYIIGNGIVYIVVYVLWYNTIRAASIRFINIRHGDFKTNLSSSASVNLTLGVDLDVGLPAIIVY